jgi:hypothetical protein
MTAYPTLVMRTSFVLLVFAVDGERLPRKELQIDPQRLRHAYSIFLRQKGIA